jgi:hypothetical protein
MRVKVELSHTLQTALQPNRHARCFEPDGFHFISPERPAVMARMQPALLVLQEYKSMEVTSDNGYGFVNVVRLKRNGMIFPFAEYSPCHKGVSPNNL